MHMLRQRQAVPDTERTFFLGVWTHFFFPDIFVTNKGTIEQDLRAGCARVEELGGFAHECLLVGGLAMNSEVENLLKIILPLPILS